MSILGITWKIENSVDKQCMTAWLEEFLPNTLVECENTPTNETTIFVYEINHLFDWLR